MDPQPHHHTLSSLPPRCQGVAADKAKLEFVRAYWEFPAKALYQDARAAAAPAAADKKADA